MSETVEVNSYIGLVKEQKRFFKTRETFSSVYRKKQLKKLYQVLEQNEDRMYQAIAEDLGKSEFDTFVTELSVLYNEINFYIKNVVQLKRPKSVSTNLSNRIANSRICYEALGNILVIGAWNYPYHLSFLPMISAIAAGNTCIVKPSELSPNTARVMAEIVNENFDRNYLHVVEGGVPEVTNLLECKFDKIFFTGGGRVGKIVYQAAARQLTPVVLELGGKSPVIVTESADVDVTAKRIVWGKFLNAGQTCVAPDYVLVQEAMQEKLIDRLIYYIKKFKYKVENQNYAKIVNRSNFNRLLQLIQPDKLAFGGDFNQNTLEIYPTILKNVDFSDACMQDEIFGPILPIITYKEFRNAIDYISDFEKPLAAYLFTSNGGEKETFMKYLSFGGGCINDVLMHMTNESLPFGGVGGSGFGKYHGEHGFYEFTNPKPILDRATWGEPNLKYPPYTKEKLTWLKRLLLKFG